MVMGRTSFIRGAAALVCVLGLNFMAAGQDYNITEDDLFGDAPPAGAASGGGKSGGAYTGAGNSTGGFDESAIQDLFGSFDAGAEESKDTAAPARVLPPFHGNYKVLVGRPIYAVYEPETKTKWLSATAELYTLYKIASFPRTHVFSMEQVDGVLPNYRDYARKFNRQHFINAAEKLGATHLIYQEYQPHKNGKEGRYVIDLYWLQEKASVVKVSETVIFSAYEQGLDRILVKIAEAMDPGAKNTQAFKQSVWGRDQKFIQAFGDALSNEGQFTSERASAAYTAVDKVMQKNKKNADLIGVQLASALIAGRAGGYDNAIGHINRVISASGDHPALQLYLAEYLRGAGRHSEALRAAETAGRNPALSTPASIEKAAIYAAQGDLNQARAEYSSIMQSGDADGRVYFRLALLSIQSGNIQESEDYLRQATESGLNLDSDENIQIGIAYGRADGYEDKAIEMIKKGMGARQNNEMAWSAIADIYKKMGNRQAEADTYVNLFKINQNLHSGKLREAGEIYEELGMINKAKDAYSLYIDRKFSNADVSMSLARIYFNEQNCRRLPDILKGYDTIPEAAQMLADCGFKTRRVDASQTMQKKKLSPLMLTLRITSGAAAVGGIAGGIICNSTVESEYEKYSKWKDDWTEEARDKDKVKDMRKKMDDNITMRNLLYGVAALGVAGFAVTWFF